MQKPMTDAVLLHELEPIAADNVNRHLSTTKDWYPHDYVPWQEGRNFAATGGTDWCIEQSQLGEVARAAMITNLLTEDNLPSYHREAAGSFSQDGPWGTWVNRWTTEENRHGIALRDYLVVTRAVDVEALERARMEHVTNGFAATDEERAKHDSEFLMSVVLRDLPGTGHPGESPQHRQGLRRPDRRPVAAAHRRRREPAHDLLPQRLWRRAWICSPDQTLDAVAAVVENFRMPGSGHARLPAQRRADGQARDLRSAPAPRRGGHADPA